MPNYYAVLGVPRTAAPEDVKKAFRAIALENHPDKKPGDTVAEARFKEASEAYEVLMDAERRSAYDRTGQHPSIRSTDFVNVASVFRDLFSGWAPKAAADVFGGPARDITVDIELTFQEAAAGSKRELRVSRGGSWNTLEIRIPPGVEDGTRIRLRGAGEQIGGAVGDLYLNLTVRPDPLFERSGLDLHTMAIVPYTTLVLGGAIQISTPAGPLSINIKAGTQADDVISLKRFGLQDPGGRYSQGDLHVHLRTAVHTRLTTAQRDLYEQLAALEGGAAVPLPKKKRAFR